MQYSLKLLLAILVCATFCQAQSDSIPALPADQPELVFVLHGLGRTKSAMWLLAARLEDAGFSVKRIGYHSLKESPEEILADVSSQINAGLQETNQPVHFVGHSMGGLMIRAYLDSHQVEHLGRVVLIGTPNQGTTFVDKYRDKWWLKMLGPMTLALGTDRESFASSIADPYYPVGVIAGISDRIKNDRFLPGTDDGLVQLESTRLDGMTDLIIIKSGHAMLRYDRDVANQTIAFLKTGKFKQAKVE